MNKFGKAALSAVLLASAAAFTAAPASADVGIGFSFGSDGGYFSDPCDYYNYYDAPPPWGLPPDYCDYPVYFEPVYYGGYWYRGPIYYRWYGGERMFWLNGSWHHNEWRGAMPSIRWTDRGGWNRGRGWSGGGHNTSGGSNWSGRGGDWNRTRGGQNWSGSSGGHNWSGGSASGGHGWSGGGGGGNNHGGGGGGNHHR